MNKIKKIASGIVYSIGTCITIFLSIIVVSHSDIILNPDAMLPFQLYEQAFIWLAFGAIPMVIASYIAYKVFDVKNSYNYKRNRILIFIPSIICISCAAYVFGLLFMGMINSII